MKVFFQYFFLHIIFITQYRNNHKKSWLYPVSLSTPKLKFKIKTLKLFFSDVGKCHIFIFRKTLQRYGIGVYLASSVQLDIFSPLSSNLNKLQVKQNDCMRLILNKKRSDHISRESLLQGCKMKSVNQMAASAIIMELWRAFQHNIDSITGAFSTNRSQRHGSWELHWTLIHLSQLVQDCGTKSVININKENLWYPWRVMSQK